MEAIRTVAWEAVCGEMGSKKKRDVWAEILEAREIGETSYWKNQVLGEEYGYLAEKDQEAGLAAQFGKRR